MQINDLSARIKVHEKLIKSTINRVIDSGWLVLGPEVKRFESLFAEYIGAKHCVGVANGTDALELALRAIGVETGHRVATVANAGMYTTTTILTIGATPFFLEVDVNTRNTTLSEVERAIEVGVNAVVVTHLYGLSTSEIGEIAQFCKKKGIPLLEDCAQAHGAILNGKRVGTFGDAACFSFYPTKNLGALGDGGVVLTDNAQLAEKVLLLRQYGWKTKYQVEFAGARNSRLDEIQAAILSELLPYLDDANSRRREIARRYSNQIEHPDVCLPKEAKLDYVAHLYVLRTNNRDSLRKHLGSLDIGSDVHYPVPDHRQPLFGERFVSVRLKNTERLSSEVLTLPCYPEMTDDQVEQVISAVNTWQP